jgi:protein SCO1/2
MKTKIILLLSLALNCAPAAAPAKANADCCAKECADEKPSPTLSARSLYRLDARFTDDQGATVSLSDLRDRPVVLAMFFASCEYACPIIVNDMKRLRTALPAGTNVRPRFVLVSFDSARDNTAALRAYRERMNLDADWTLLRSEPASVQELAMLLGVKFKRDDRGQLSHSNIITILNPEGEIPHQQAGLVGDVSGAAKIVAGLKRSVETEEKH